MKAVHWILIAVAVVIAAAVGVVLYLKKKKTTAAIEAPAPGTEQDARHVEAREPDETVKVKVKSIPGGARFLKIMKTARVAVPGVQ